MNFLNFIIVLQFHSVITKISKIRLEFELKFDYIETVPC